MGNTLKIKGKNNVCMSVEGLLIRLRSSTQSQVEQFCTETHIISYTLQGTNISPKKLHFEDFSFPKVGYVSSLEGISYV